MPSNRYREAFMEQANLIGLASSVALSAALLNPLPFLAALVAETAYMITVPDSKWYKGRLDKRAQAEEALKREQRKAQLFPLLSPLRREQILRLEQMATQIKAQGAESPYWVPETLYKLDYLWDKFLVFAGKEAQFTQYLASVHEEVCGSRPILSRQKGDPFTLQGVTRRMGPSGEAVANEPPPLDPTAPWVNQAIGNIRGTYTKELKDLQQMIDNEKDNSTKAVLVKRTEILQRRAEFLDKIEKTLANLAHQMQLLEDTFGLINDEVRARSPEQILEDINEVVSQTDSMTQVLDELAPYEQMVSRITAEQ